jgi:N-acetylglucosamine malate deacetylase 2
MIDRRERRQRAWSITAGAGGRQTRGALPAQAFCEMEEEILTSPLRPQNGMEDLRPLLRTTLILAAHPDDELVICGALMQKMEHATVVFATDGAPRNEAFWRQYGSRQAYADVRREEAGRALHLARAHPVFLADHVAGGIVDQELFRNLAAALAAIEKIVAQVKPESILAPAYEGGHPDHDAACFIASVAGRRRGLPVWESPLYHRRADGSSVVQTFPEMCGREVEVRHEGQVLETKLKMFHIYRSQGSVLEAFRPEVEAFRPICDYDFTRPPLPWKLNYEHWGWTMTGEEVATVFADWLRKNPQSTVVSKSW